MSLILEVLLDQVDDAHARALCKAVAVGVHSGDGAIARKRDAQSLGQAADGIGGEHAGAAAAARARRVLVPIAILCRHSAPGDLPNRVEQRVEVRLGLAVAVAAGEHWAAGDEHRGEVDAQGAHDHARDDLVAGGDKHDAVEGMALDRALDAVRDDLAARQGVLHALVVHSDAVAYADGAELHGDATGHVDAGLHVVDEALEMIVSRDNICLGGDDGDERLVALELFVRHAVCIQQAAMRGALEPFSDLIASHLQQPYLSVFALDALGKLCRAHWEELPGCCSGTAAALRLRFMRPDCGYPTDPAY